MTTRSVGKYGLRPSPLGKVWKLKLRDYMHLTDLPPIPKGAFGHLDKVAGPWGVLKNDVLGCCVVSGAEHETMLWTAESGGPTAAFDDESTILNYRLLGNYVPGDEDTDQGCDMLTAAELRIKQGIRDAKGKTHKLGIALELDSGPGYLNLDQFWYALWLFDGIGLGIGVTAQMQADFAAEKPWTASSFNPTQILGGHYVPAVARESVNLHGQTVFDADVISWGEKQAISTDGLQAITNTVLVYATKEKLNRGKDMEGLGWNDMRSDIRKLVA